MSENRQNEEAVEHESTEKIDANKLLEFGSLQIINLFVPVSLCMIIVGIVARNIQYYQSTTQYLIYTPFHSENANAATTVWESLANAMIFISFVVVMTIVLVLLYKYHCYKFIYGYLIFATVMILFVMFTIFFVSVAMSLNVYVDYLTMSVLIWNFGVGGFLVIHWRGPLLLQQAYLIVISAKLSLILLKYMPLWTTWVLLGVLAIWDLIAVLCPFGPLRILVNIAQERNEPLFPALIYSTTATMVVGEKQLGDDQEDPNQQPSGSSAATTVDRESAAGDGHSVEGATAEILPTVSTPKAQQNQHQPNTETVSVEQTEDNVGVIFNEGENRNQRLRRNIRDIQDDVIDRGDRGVKLGLGDFVFYSLLMGRATLDSDPASILACYVAILVGMFLTILLLAVAGRALPALPISLACGILFYFLTSLIIQPFTQSLALARVFI